MVTHGTDIHFWLLGPTRCKHIVKNLKHPVVIFDEIMTCRMLKYRNKRVSKSKVNGNVKGEKRIKRL